MLGMDDIMFLFILCKFWYIPPWLGDGCMFDRKVIMMYKFMFLLKTIFLQTLPTVRGSLDSTTKQRIQHALRGSITLCP